MPDLYSIFSFNFTRCQCFYYPGSLLSFSPVDMCEQFMFCRKLDQNLVLSWVSFSMFTEYPENHLLHSFYLVRYCIDVFCYCLLEYQHIVSNWFLQSNVTLLTSMVFLPLCLQNNLASPFSFLFPLPFLMVVRNNRWLNRLIVLRPNGDYSRVHEGNHRL
jgi:hypothetical protein